MTDLLTRTWRTLPAAAGLLLFSAAVLFTRCANYQEVFVGGNVLFTDADCYARMTRVQLCAQHPGVVVRHHDFENYPAGTSPHTTAPMDYAILLLAEILRPLTSHWLDLGGALISPFLALLTAWFLWWWARRLKVRYRGILFVVYAVSPILVHGTELGRPDHQSLLMGLMFVSLCAEWSWRASGERTWTFVSAISWSIAIWVSAYEPLILLLGLGLISALLPGERAVFFKGDRRNSWLVFAGILVLALLVERRIPAFPILAESSILQNWARTIGEMRRVALWNPIWFQWLGWLVLILPGLAIWFFVTRPAQERWKGATTWLVTLCLLTFVLTIWQVRWAYFFVILFALALVALLSAVKRPALVWVGFVIALFPLLQGWDEQLWPNDEEIARRAERRAELTGLHDLAIRIRSGETRPFLAVWWHSPAIAYWSGQPGVGGSSHEAIEGIADSARFFAASTWQKPREIIENHKIGWVFGYDAGRTAETSAAILAEPVGQHAVCYQIDRAPAQPSPVLVFVAQNAGGKLFQIGNNL